MDWDYYLENRDAKIYLLRDQGPEFVQVDAGLVEVGVVGVHMEVPHTNLQILCQKKFLIDV